MTQNRVSYWIEGLIRSRIPLSRLTTKNVKQHQFQLPIPPGDCPNRQQELGPTLRIFAHVVQSTNDSGVRKQKSKLRFSTIMMTYPMDPRRQLCLA